MSGFRLARMASLTPAPLNRSVRFALVVATIGFNSVATADVQLVDLDGDPTPDVVERWVEPHSIRVWLSTRGATNATGTSAPTRAPDLHVVSPFPTLQSFGDQVWFSTDPSSGCTGQISILSAVPGDGFTDAVELVYCLDDGELLGGFIWWYADEMLSSLVPAGATREFLIDGYDSSMGEAMGALGQASGGGWLSQPGVVYCTRICWEGPSGSGCYPWSCGSFGTGTGGGGGPNPTVPGTPGDCNGNGVPDALEIGVNHNLDCNDDGIMDACQVSASTDCNGNGVLDACEFGDCDNDGVPDSCEDDSDSNGIPDDCDDDVVSCPEIVRFLPDPTTHDDREALVILTGDRETLEVTWPRLERIRLELIDPSVAKFVINGALLATVQPTGPPPKTFKVAGIRSGTTRIEARRVTDNQVLGCIQVKVGGTVKIEFNGLPSFVVYPTSGGGLAGGEPPPPPPPFPHLVLGGAPLGSGAPDARSPVDPELISKLAAEVPPFVAHFRVELIGPDGEPKRGRRVTIVSRDGVVEVASVVGDLTNVKGRAEFTLGARSTLQSDLGLDSEHPFVEDNVAVLFGDTAERFLNDDIPIASIDAIREEITIPDHVNTGHSLRSTRILEVANNGGVEAATAVDMGAINHVAASILRQHLEGDVYGWPVDLGGGTIAYFDPFAEQWVTATVPDQVGVLHDPPALYGAVIPDLDSRPNYAIEPVDPTDLPPGGSNMWVTASAISAEIAIGLAPFGDLIEAGRELFSYWLGYSTEIDYMNLGLCAVGLLADAGYLAGPVGLIGNVGVAAIRVALRIVPPEVMTALLKLGPTVIEALKTFALDYLSKIPIPASGSLAERAAAFAGLIVGPVKATVNAAWGVTADHYIKVVKVVGEIDGMISELAHAGLGFVARLFDDINPEILGTLKAAIPAAAAKDSLESMGSAFGRARARIGDPSNTAESALLRDAVNAATHANLTGPPGLRSALNAACVGANKPFKSAQELEACLRMHGDDLTSSQRQAIRDARLSLFEGAAKPLVGTLMTRVIKHDEAIAMLTANKMTVQGFVATSATVEGVASSPALINRLRLDYDGGFSPVQGHVRIEFPLDSVSHEQLKVPMGRGHYVGPDGDVILINSAPPNTGTGVVASTDGFLSPEFRSLDPMSLQIGATMRFNDAAGNAQIVNVYLGGESLSAAVWQVMLIDGQKVWRPAP